jgi:hypothetical protein
LAIRKIELTVFRRCRHVTLHIHNEREQSIKPDMIATKSNSDCVQLTCNRNGKTQRCLSDRLINA